jgi:transcriptional regulator with XRE-family HTH domain
MSDNLWALREQKKISVATVAGRAGLPIGLIMEYEAGQRSIDPRHLSRLARALYVEESDIRLRSDPKPGAGQLERQPGRSNEVRPAGSPLAAERPARPPRPLRTAPLPRPPQPARPSQFSHLDHLLKRLGRTRAEIEAEQTTPLAEMDRSALSSLLKKLQEQAKGATVVERHRAYLPEGVEEYEARYLTAILQAGEWLVLTLFDGSAVAGQLIGFGVYNLTLRLANGDELSVNKLALVSYRRKEPAT